MVSVVTLTHNKLACTRRCLPTLLESGGDRWQLIVVDNGSSDGTVDWLAGFHKTADEHGVDLKVIANSANIGCSTARNQGANAADGDFLVFMDNDVALRSRNWLSMLHGRFAAPDVSVVGPKLVYPTPPHDIQCAGVGISRDGRVEFRGRGEPRTSGRFNVEEDVQCLISACFMVRRTHFERAGGFDEAFNPVEYEDFDLCYRMREQGGRALYFPPVEMYHFESVTTAGTSSLPNTYLIIKHGLLFKKRWRHMFSEEEGPPNEATRWRKRDPIELAGVGELALIN